MTRSTSAEAVDGFQSDDFFSALPSLGANARVAALVKQAAGLTRRPPGVVHLLPRRTNADDTRRPGLHDLVRQPLTPAASVHPRSCTPLGRRRRAIVGSSSEVRA